MTFIFKHPSKYKNPTLTKNMPNVKWDQIPPVSGP